MITEQKIAWNPYFYSAKTNLDQIMTPPWTRYWPLKRPNLDQILTSQHIYIYTHMQDGCQGDHVSSKNGAVRGPPKSRFGDRAFSHYKNRNLRGKVWQQQKRPKVTNCPPPSQELCFVETHTWICVHGALGRETSLTGCCLYTNRVFWGSHCARVVRMYQFEIFVCV